MLHLLFRFVVPVALYSWAFYLMGGIVANPVAILVGFLFITGAFSGMVVSDIVKK